MKIYIANDSKQTIGGGWSFIRNFRKGVVGNRFAEITDVMAECDIVFIPSSSMIAPDTLYGARDLGKKIVLRVDNVPRNSRNRNTGTSRLKRASELANLVIYQSKWSLSYLSPFLQKKGPIINNGVDTEIFNVTGPRYDWGDHVYLYSRFNRDETKRWEEAWYKFQIIQRRNPSAKLKIVGQFSEELIKYNFDFFMGEDVEYVMPGIITDPYQMAKIYRSCKYLMAPYYNDCHSNTYCEALACGTLLYEPNMTGGTPEILENYHLKGVRSIEAMVDEYINYFKTI